MKRFLTAILVLLLFLAGGASYAQDNADPPLDVPVTSEPEKINVQTLDVPKEPDIQTKDANSVTDFVAQDLAVQERMADAAEKANKLVKKQNWIGIFGLGLVALTAWFAWGAWRAGKDAVDVTRDIGEKQVRAYLGFDSGEWWSQGAVILLHIILKNYGQSPCKAGKVTATMVMRRFLVDFKDGKIVEDDKISSMPMATPVGIIEAGGMGSVLLAFGFYKKDIDKKWLYAASDVNTDVDFEINLEWTDVFGNTSETRFFCRNDTSFEKEQEKSDRYQKIRSFNQSARYIEE